MSSLDAHERPPEDLKAVFKYYQQLSLENLAADTCFIQGYSSSPGSASTLPKVVRLINTAKLHFGSETQDQQLQRQVLEWPDLPGLHFIPGLLSQETQLQLLSLLLHRDLANPQHQTNLHKHFILPYHLIEAGKSGEAKSFFSIDPALPELIHPHDPSIHKPFPFFQLLHKKLRWLTLGGQYDWTSKVYPDEQPPSFPSDVSNLVQKAFPEMRPQAAIVNVYSPGDTLALHRDVSEASENGLVSISIGCEAVFITGLRSENGLSKWRAFRLRSGDAIYMSGPSRYAWHGVAKILKDTCPDVIQSWPAGIEDDVYSVWKNWMAGKRINLNIRQMFDE
ncbi:MAG: hypothetical protein GOMPHAMPRED_005584 [Gomphillus americanus]|uniref:mRNA N(6)-methyladenine demethylase n=1 Tax=Gomphillus americanus TaxID=1940652 RepID=A0A8H3FT42_9LECA|nr:MAG: hypothetical protein GOMPHAMPRED_005584 [Gomphillus americanus]